MIFGFFRINLTKNPQRHARGGLWVRLFSPEKPERYGWKRPDLNCIHILPLLGKEVKPVIFSGILLRYSQICPDTSSF